MFHCPKLPWWPTVYPRILWNRDSLQTFSWDFSSDTFFTFVHHLNFTPSSLPLISPFLSLKISLLCIRRDTGKEEKGFLVVKHVPLKLELYQESIFGPPLISAFTVFSLTFSVWINEKMESVWTHICISGYKSIYIFWSVLDHERGIILKCQM